MAFRAPPPDLAPPGSLNRAEVAYGLDLLIESAIENRERLKRMVPAPDMFSLADMDHVIFALRAVRRGIYS